MAPDRIECTHDGSEWQICVQKAYPIDKGRAFLKHSPAMVLTGRSVHSQESRGCSELMGA